MSIRDMEARFHEQRHSLEFTAYIRYEVQMSTFEGYTRHNIGNVIQCTKQNDSLGEFVKLS